MEKKKRNKRKKWLKFRHKIVTALLFLILYPYIRIRYKIKIERFKDEKKRNYLILMNHQTAFDQFFVSLSFLKPIYYVATEDIFSLGWISSVIKYLVAPIPIKKQTTDLTAVMTCIRVGKEGGSVAIAPEGNRTYSGKTEYMNPVISSLAKKMKLPIVLYRIEGGYGSEPRWGHKVRKGRVHAYVSRVIEPCEYESMTDEELFSVIQQGLYVNEAESSELYYSKKSAEYLERAIYVCPDCGLSSFYSKGDTVTCLRCQKKVRYGADKRLTVDAGGFPFTYVNDWYEYQKAFINRLDLSKYREVAAFTDITMLSEVVVYKKKYKLRKSASVSLYGDRIVIDEGKENEMILPFSEVSALAVLGRNKANIYHGKQVFQLKGDKRFNALKDVNFYYRYKNIESGELNGEFLGI